MDQTDKSSVKEALSSKDEYTGKVSSDFVELPNGYLDKETMELHTRVCIKEITGVEEDIIANVKMSPHKRMTEVLKKCIVEIAGTDDKEKISEIVDSLLSQDRYFLLLKIRVLTLGRKYSYSMPCPSCNFEDSSRPYNLDLEQVTFSSMKNPKQHIYDGTLPKSGLTYKFRVQTGKVEEAAQKILKKTDSILTAALVQRVIDLNGAPPKFQDIQSLSSKDRNFLRQEMKKIEGEIDDKMEMTCPSCGYEFSEDLDISSREFFFPSEM